MRKLRWLAVTLFLFAGSGCSVFMAAKHKGVELDEVTSCKTRTCMQGKGAELVSSTDSAGGTLIESYKVRKPTGSSGRAVMHGILDVATLGIWEIAGTPIEGAQNQDEFIALQVTSEKTTGNILKVEVPQ